jgi:hypothetical protein
MGKVMERAREKVMERAREKVVEKVREQVMGKVVERARVMEKAMKRGVAIVFWGVPTYPDAWTANLQLPCGSGLALFA